MVDRLRDWASRQFSEARGRFVEQRAWLTGTRAGRAVGMLLLALTVATLIGLAVLWPTGEQPQFGRVLSGSVQAAEVTQVLPRVCPVEAKPGCKQVNVKLTDGPGAGSPSFLMLPGDEAAPKLKPGDRIRVLKNDQSLITIGTVPRSGEPLEPSQAPFGFVDFERRGPILLLVIIFALLVVVLGRTAGFLSLLGLGVGLLLVSKFVIPAILDGASPFAVGLVGSFAVMLTTIVITYGAGAKSLAALLGTAASLALTAILALIFVHSAHLTGTSSEDATLVQSVVQSRSGQLSLQGLVLASMVIAALGVLNDVTVSQASTVIALRRANPAQRLRELFRGAMAVGRDHLGATVNTLVFAYAGAALPLLLLFNTQDTSFGETVNRESVATELVATLVGSIGLVAAVPLTTLLAALLATRLPASEIPAEDADHGHAH
jgi:uncharacterized membrane protein